VVWQTIEVQSEGAEQVLPVPQGLHEPPQSMSDSEPFFWPSLQPGAAQTLPVQMFDWQSPALPHPRPSVHLGHVVPPQSTSDSLPLRVWSVHVGLWQIFELLHTELEQSPLPLHVLPWPQRGQVCPPQSVSDSLPFFTESLHSGA
jgi:hypothetical protein